MYKVFFTLVFLTVTVIANAQDQKYNRKLYIRADVGGFIPVNKFKEEEDDHYITKKPKNGTVYNAGFGYIINSMWRGDLNFNYRNLRYKASEEDGTFNTMKQKINMHSLFLNGYFDLNFHKTFKPYLKAGMGYSRNNSSTALFYADGDLVEEFPGKKTNNFAWNIGAGIRIIFNDRFNLDFSYKYVDLGKVTTKSSDDGTIGRTFKVKFHDIMGGILVHL